LSVPAAAAGLPKGKECGRLCPFKPSLSLQQKVKLKRSQEVGMEEKTENQIKLNKTWDILPSSHQSAVVKL